MIRHGQENLVLSEKLHRWTRALMLTLSPGDLPEVLVRELKHQFMIPQGGIRVWGGSDMFGGMPFAHAVSDDVKVFSASLSVPYCGVNSGFEAAQWLEEPAAAMSLAMIPLREGGNTGAFGLLVLASPDATRYTADMGTEFLSRVGEIASAALSRLLPPKP
jgi:uncharacterized protein YigA (DUF484 family)